METLKKYAFVFLVRTFVITLAITTTVQAEQASQAASPSLKEYRIVRSVSENAQGCIDCHAEKSKGIVADWASSRHAHANISCLDCHIAGPADADISKDHLQYDKTLISVIVSPKDCSRCHPTEAAQYAKSKHANTLELIWKIDPWLNDGMNNDIERQTGCFHCHGSIVKVENGKFDTSTWPNVGVGRINPDGSKGSCSSCHTRHKFSLSEARKPEACGQCHLGPDHPQVEIYNESKHGAIYHAEGDSWNWNAAPGTWTPGVDYRAPTCSICHMSAVNGVAATHDVTERLAWETQAPLTVRPSEFKPWPAKTDWKKERRKMETICLACHSQAWTTGHFTRFDAAVVNYNDNYYKPMKKLIDGLYEKKLLCKEKNLDEKLEIDMYELWHHEGRRARFGAAMMAPDYAWWHGFYELKKRCMAIEEQVEELLRNGKPAKVFKVKGSGGDTTKPDFGK
ncbi:MAG: hydroxylamine oxidoreductase [Planctomycetes bacterium]|nr:hydroxylamine oxidoreductase [Planctomycetota bacterium]MCH8118163.1 hydroxylamine oxidoreductase [Planctomycetota bacterium]